MKKLIILSLIITSLFIISCKGSGGGNSGSSTNTTTPTVASLEGTWKDTTTNQTITFTGSNFSATQPDIPNTLDPSGDAITMVFTGTYRTDSGKIYITPTAVSATVGTTPMSQADLNTFISVGGTMPLNTEEELGAYTINGNTLTISDPSNPSSTQTFTKQ